MLQINLLPVREVRKRFETRQIVLQQVLVLILTAAAIGAFHTRLSSRIERTQGRIHQMDKDIAQFKPQIEQVEGFKKKKKELEKKIEVIETLDRQRRGPVRILAELSDRIPDRVWLTSLETNGSQVKLAGESLDNELVAIFVRNLGESKYFGDVDLDGTKLSKQKHGLNLVHFDVKATLLGPKGPAPAPAAPKGAAGKRGKPAQKRG
jgi:type IV pilus assembly protein PilN